MSLTTILAGDIAEYRGEAEPAFARLYANQQFTTDDGIVVAQGSTKKPAFYQEFTAIRNGDFIHLLEGDAYATTNSNKPMSTCTLVVYDVNGRILVTPYHRLRISHQPSLTTWAALEIFSGAVPMRYPPHYLSAEAILALFDELDGIAEWGSIAGDIEDQTDLVMLIESAGGGDKHLEGEANLVAAIAAIGAAQADLYIKEDITVAANTTIPANVHLVIEDGAVITVGGGVTLTINSFRDPGNVRAFAGTGAVRFAKGAVDAYKAAWRAPSGNVTAAINEGLANVAAWGGGQVLLPTGALTTTGEHVMVTGAQIIGAGGGRTTENAGSGTHLKLTANARMFRFGGGVYFQKFKGLHVDGASGAASSFVYGEGSGIGELASQGIILDDCTVHSFEDAIYFNSLVSGWQASGLTVKDSFLSSSGGNSVFRCNSPNMDTISFKNCNFLTGDSRLVHGEAVYNIGFENCIFQGSGANLKGTSQLIASAVVAPAGITAGGIATCTVTWPSLGVAIPVLVPLTTADDTAAKIARKFAEALEDNVTISSHFWCGTDGGSTVILCAIDPAVNDAAANFTIETGTATGITNDLTSTNSVAGALPLVGNIPAIEIGEGSNNIQFFNCAEEGFGTFVKMNAGQASFHGCTLLDPIKGTSPFATVFSTQGCRYIPKIFQGAYAGVDYVSSIGDLTYPSAYLSGGISVSLYTTRLLKNGSALISSDAYKNAYKFGGLVRIRESVPQVADTPLLRITSADGNKNFLQIGQQTRDSEDDPLYVYNFKRDGASAHLKIEPPAVLQGTVQDGVQFSGIVRNAANIITREYVPGNFGAVGLDLTYTNRFYVEPINDITFETSGLGAVDGNQFHIVIKTISTVDRVIDFGTGFNPNIKPFHTGTVSGQTFMFSFLMRSGQAELVGYPRAVASEVDGHIEVPAVPYSSTDWEGAYAATAPRREEVSDVARTQFVHLGGGLDYRATGTVQVSKRVECVSTAQVIYTVPAGYILIGSGGVAFNPTAASITNMRVRHTIDGVDYYNLAGATIASKASSSGGGVSVTGVAGLPEGSVITLDADAVGLVWAFRGILIPLALNPRIKHIKALLGTTPTPVYVTPAGKGFTTLSAQGPYNGPGQYDGAWINMPSGVSANVTMTLRPTATPYDALKHDLGVLSAPVGGAASGRPLIMGENQTAEVTSSDASAGQMIRVYGIEFDV
jgi:hypothetical protein